jgi:hypothetical protein
MSFYDLSFNFEQPNLFFITLQVTFFKIDFFVKVAQKEITTFLQEGLIRERTTTK